MPAIATNSHLSHGTRIDAIKKGRTTTAVNSLARPEVFVDGCWVAVFKTVGIASKLISFSPGL